MMILKCLAAAEPNMATGYDKHKEIDENEEEESTLCAARHDAVMELRMK